MVSIFPEQIQSYFTKYLLVCRVNFRHLSNMNHDKILAAWFIVADMISSIETDSQRPNGFTVLSQDKWKRKPERINELPSLATLQYFSSAQCHGKPRLDHFCRKTWLHLIPLWPSPTRKDEKIMNEHAWKRFS